jgi:hypothetical protein
VASDLTREPGVSDPSQAASRRGSTARVGTLPASPTSKPRWEASGLNCSRRSRPGCGHFTASPERGGAVESAPGDQQASGRTGIVAAVAQQQGVAHARPQPRSLPPGEPVSSEERLALDCEQLGTQFA